MKPASEHTASYLDLPRLAVYASLGVSTIREYIRSGGLPAFKLKGKIVVRRSEFDRWMEGHRFDPARDLDSIADEVLKELGSDA